ncbi:hypothetical protein D3C81_1838850 [compost metagenome]
MVPESINTRSAPAPNVTSPLIAPEPLAGKVRELLPRVSVSGPLVPLAHVWLVSPGPGSRLQAASTTGLASSKREVHDRSVLSLG